MSAVCGVRSATRELGIIAVALVESHYAMLVGCLLVPVSSPPVSSLCSLRRVPAPTERRKVDARTRNRVLASLPPRYGEPKTTICAKAGQGEDNRRHTKHLRLEPPVPNITGSGDRCHRKSSLTLLKGALKETGIARRLSMRCPSLFRLSQSAGRASEGEHAGGCHFKPFSWMQMPLPYDILCRYAEEPR
eukprot:scaffold579430_cov45-Prasinocladus_malaysianus.AAC.1